MRRLSLRTLGHLPHSVHSGLDPRGLGIGIVHLGIGGFHRAHQAVFTEDAMLATGETGWAVSAVTQRGPAVRDRLAPQDGLYTVATRGRSESGYRVVTTVREVLDGPSEADAVLDRLADPAVSVVTLTVTEKAYRLDPAQRGLDLTDPDVRDDAAGAPPRTVVGRLVQGLHRRQARDAAPLTVLCCDNLTDNGGLLRRAVLDFCTLLRGGDATAAWIDEHVAFPSTMVAGSSRPPRRPTSPTSRPRWACATTRRWWPSRSGSGSSRTTSVRPGPGGSGQGRCWCPTRGRTS
ncbi:hypothetical protein [Prauserella muralis]|uniref:Mannitol dehydrogenase N-terminal domain-containing protein n=1 Tax=Prauserella muralis TaxID=588067 RepID=A0A2V4AMQ2_9PSEU|nr:hypothetical protein BAY60_28190 [Prauserella muralis]